MNTADAEEAIRPTVAPGGPASIRTPDDTGARAAAVESLPPRVVHQRHDDGGEVRRHADGGDVYQRVRRGRGAEVSAWVDVTGKVVSPALIGTRTGRIRQTDGIWGGAVYA